MIQGIKFPNSMAEYSCIYIYAKCSNDHCEEYKIKDITELNIIN